MTRRYLSRVVPASAAIACCALLAGCSNGGNSGGLLSGSEAGRLDGYFTNIGSEVAQGNCAGASYWVNKSVDQVNALTTISVKLKENLLAGLYQIESNYQAQCQQAANQNNAGTGTTGASGPTGSTGENTSTTQTTTTQTTPTTTSTVGPTGPGDTGGTPTQTIPSGGASGPVGTTSPPDTGGGSPVGSGNGDGSGNDVAVGPT